MVPGDQAAGSEARDAGLGYGEQLLVWTWRKLAIGLGDCPLIAREFSKLCGDDAAEILATFCTFLAALAAAQASDVTRFEAPLRWLARAELRPALAIAARALGTALKGHNLPLGDGTHRSIRDGSVM